MNEKKLAEIKAAEQACQKAGDAYVEAANAYKELGVAARLAVCYARDAGLAVEKAEEAAAAVCRDGSPDTEVLTPGRVYRDGVALTSEDVQRD